MFEGRGKEGCYCDLNLWKDLPAGVRPVEKKKSLLNKVTCRGCGKVFSTNRETEYCFDCQKILDSKRKTT